MFITIFLGILFYNRDRWFSQNRQRRGNNFKFSWLFAHGQMRFIFPSEQDVTDAALSKSRSSTTRTRIQYFGLFVDLTDKVLCFGLIAAFLMFGPGPCR